MATASPDGSDSTPDDPPRPGGRPRGPSAATRYAVLSAAWRILADEGISALTPTRLHDETGVARTTIYRHWPEPVAVVADIVGAAARVEPGERSGDTRADLLTALRSLTFSLRHRPVAPLVSALMATGAGGGAGGPAPVDYVGALLAPLRDVVADGLERGTLRVDRRVEPGEFDIEPVADTLLRDLAGPLILDVLLLGGDPELIDDEIVVERFLERYGVRASPVVPSMPQPDAGANGDSASIRTAGDVSG